MVEQKLTASEQYDYFGVAVSVSGNVSVVRAGGAGDDNSAYVYRFVGGTWVEEAELVAPFAPADDIFGISVSDSGDVVVVGAEYDSCAAGNRCGSAYVYRFNGST